VSCVTHARSPTGHLIEQRYPSRASRSGVLSDKLLVILLVGSYFLPSATFREAVWGWVMFQGSITTFVLHMINGTGKGAHTHDRVIGAGGDRDRDSDSE